MNKTKLKKCVQQLGELRAQMTDLKSAERALSDEITEAMTGAKKITAVESADYVAQLNETWRLILDVKKFRRKAGEKVFLECAKVDMKVARRHFDDKALEKLGEVKASVQLRISRRPK